MIRPNLHDRTTNPNGTRTLDDLKIMTALYDKVVELEGKLDAIAAITAPAGGATIDAEARTAINSIISAAT